MGFFKKIIGRERENNSEISNNKNTKTSTICFYHEKKQTVAQCTKCEQGICSKCISKKSQGDNEAEIICKACSSLNVDLENAGSPVIGSAVSGYRLLGGLAQRAKQAEESISYYQLGANLAKATGDDEMQAKCLNGIGQAYVSIQNPEKALGYHQECMRLAPNYGVGHEALVIAYWVLGRLDEAKRELRKLKDTGFPVNQILLDKLE